MGYDRGSEPRRSLSGGRPRNYVPRRSSRAEYRSPDRPYRCADYQRRAYRNRSPDHGDKYRRRSPSGARYGRDPRPYRAARNAPYRHSRSRSPLSRRSRSAESVYRNERYTRNEAPSARFGSRASYLRLREANRAPSRSRSRAGRRKSPLRGEQASRRDTSHRSDSRGRYRERRDERTKNYVSPGPEPRTRRALDQCDPSSNKDDTRRTDKQVAAHCSEGRSVSQHNRSRRASPRISRGRKTPPPTQGAQSQTRLSKCSRSASRSASWARNRRATATSRRSPLNESRFSRRSGSGGGEAEAANTSRQSHAPEGSFTRRSPAGPRRRENEIATRYSPDQDKAARRLSFGDPTLRIDGALRRSSHSGDQPHGASRSESIEKSVVEPSKNATEAEAPSRSRSVCRSADCPTPDLVSSRPCNADNKGTNSARHSLGRQEKRTPEQEPCPKRAEVNVSSERRADDGPTEVPRRRNAVCSEARQSVSRSPPVRTMAPEVERNGGKERGSSCPATPPLTEQPVPEESRHLPEENAVSRGSGVCNQNRGPQEKERIQDQSELSTRLGDQPPPSVAQSRRSSPTQRLDERRQSERRGHEDGGRCDGHSVEASGTNITAAAIDCSRTTGEPAGPRARLASEESRRNVEVDRTIVKRRIVATEPFASIEAAEMYRPYREPSPRGYPGTQHLPRERGGRFLPPIHRFQPFSPNQWHRVDRDERLEFSQPFHPVNQGRSVRLVARRGDRNLLITAQQHMRNATPNVPHRAFLHNGMFQHPTQSQRHLNRTPIHIHPAAGRNRKMGANVGRGLPEGRNMAAAASNVDGKWSHDLFEQLSNEPERKRRRFNLYGETLERIDD